MLEILVCNDKNETLNLYKAKNINFTENCFAIRAMLGDECIGYALFSIDLEKETVFAVEPKEDRMLADGLLRSALHVGCERGIKDAFYSLTEYEELYSKINFIENKKEKRLKLQNLFTDCCNCRKD